MSQELRSRPEEEQIEKLLESFQPGPGERFYRKMAGAPWNVQPVRKRAGFLASTRARAGVLSFTVLVLVAAVIAFTSQGRALAGDMLRFFTRAESNSFPLPPEQVQPIQTSAVTEPTFVVPMGSVESELGPATKPAENGAVVPATEQDDRDCGEYAVRDNNYETGANCAPFGAQLAPVSFL